MPTATLLDLDVCNFRRLVGALQKDDGWRRVAEFVTIFDQSQISALSFTACPAESLLHLLGTKLCTLEVLAHVLRNCSLYDALLVISGPEPLRVISQPTNILQDKNKLDVRIGDPLELKFEVSGIPPPKFRWFKDDDALEDQAAAILRYERFEPDMEGEYFCCATQNVGCASEERVTSAAIRVETLPVACTVVEEPKEYVYLCEGSALLLKLGVLAYPKPSYQWLHGNAVLENETRNILFIKQVNKSHSGEYRCFISNKTSDAMVKVNVIVYEANTFKVYSEPVSSKIALLIANNDYEYQEKLHCPSNDAATVAKILQNLGFKTICLQNLNLFELKTAVGVFANCIQEKSFVFFYYAGHGFEMGDKFLVPTDCPPANCFRKSDVIPESMIFQEILNKNPVLFTFLLDMCLKLPDISENLAIYEETFVPYPFTSNRNLIRGYSTTSHLVSYEKQGSQNGIYISTLKKYLGRNLPILAILAKVNAEISLECPDQMPSIFHITAEDFYLNNAVQGFYHDENKLYTALDIKTDEAYVNGAKIRLQKHKEAFNNVLDITISGMQTLEYVLNSTKVTVEETEKCDNVVLIKVMNLQKLGSIPLSLKLVINGANFEICRHFKIANMFLEI